MEKEKLQLKHLAPYLPYGIEFKHSTMDYRGKLLFLATNNEFNLSCSDWYENLEKTEYKPILRPLSDLDNDIQLLNKISCIEKKDLIYLKASPTTNNYSSVQCLLSKHYDIFGLIKKGIAIDINTLTKP